MNPTPRTILWVGLAVAAAACVLTLSLAFKDKTPSRIVMTDGTILHVRGVIFGTNQFSSDTPQKQFVRRFLPERLSDKWLGNASTYYSGDTNGLSFYFVRKDSNGKNRPPFWGRVETIDSRGWVYSDNPGSGSYGSDEIIEFSTRAFPRRDKEFLIRIYDSSGPLRAQFMVRNPLFPREFPVWKAEPLPQTKTNGPVRFTLKGLRARKDAWGWNCSPQFTIDAPEAGWRSGKKMYRQFFDATGNQGSFLSTNEPAWKIHVQLFRPDAGKFPTNLVWRLPLMAVPAALSYTNVSASNTLDGIKIFVPAICGPGTLVISNFTNVSVAGPISRNGGWTSSSSGNPSTRVDKHSSDKVFAVIETDVLDSETELVIRFLDPDGKPLKTDSRHGWTGSWDEKRGQFRRYTVELLATNASAAALEIKVNRPLDFDFMIDPRDVTFPAQ